VKNDVLAREREREREKQLDERDGQRIELDSTGGRRVRSFGIVSCNFSCFDGPNGMRVMQKHDVDWT
jgi:hypothetical protein